MADDDDDDDRRGSDMPAVLPRGMAEQRAFDALEKDIKEFLNDIQDERPLDRFRAEYERLHRAIKKQHEIEKRLHKKAKDLSNDVAKNKKKMNAAIKINEEDQSTIASLKAEIDKNWMVVDESQEKEVEAKEKIKLLKVEITDLNAIVESGVTETMAQDTQVAELEFERGKIMRQRDVQLGILQDLQKELDDWNEKVRLTELDKINREHELALLRDETAAKKAECDRENKKKDKLEREMKELRSSMDAKQNDVKAKQAQVLENQEQVDKLDMQLKEQKGVTDKAQKELDLVLQKLVLERLKGNTIQVAKLTSDLEEQIKHNTTLMAENSQKQMDIKQKEEEIELHKQEVIKVNKARESTLNKLKTTEFVIEDLEKQRNALIEERIKIEKDIEVHKKQSDQARKRCEESVRERDLLLKMKTQAENSAEKQQDLVKINQVTIHNLEVELQKFHQHAKKQAKVINNLQEQSETKMTELTENAALYMAACEELHKREVAIIELQKKIMEGEASIKQQQNLYEVVRAERNVNSKKLLEAQGEIDEMKRKFKVMNHLVEQLKEEINSKDVAIIKEHYDHQKVVKEKENLKAELAKAQSKIKHAEIAVLEYTAQIDNLNHILEEADAEKLRQEKELAIITSEQSVLGAQLIKKNDELAMVYDKIRVQESAINKGRVEYCSRLNELRALKLKLNDLKREHTVLTGSCKNIEILRREVHNLSRELMQERTKVRALSEELENPLNVHRWRKLEGTDPQAYEMIIKIQTLQKKLTSKTEEVIEKDLLIQEKEKLYIELRKILARQPGPEAAKQMAKYGQKLHEKMKDLRFMTLELTTYQGQVDEHKKEINLYNEELEAVKKKYFQMKRQ